MTEVELTLPLPPTVNHYYGYNRKPYLTKKANGYRHDVAILVQQAGVRGSFPRGSLAMRVDLFMYAGGDVDNRLKPLLDALEYAEVFKNDRQIADLRVIRGHRVPGGRCEVKIWRL